MMRTTIEITLTPKQWASYQRDPNGFGSHVWEAEAAIRSAARKYETPWAEIRWEDFRCLLLSPDGKLIQQVQWKPMVRGPLEPTAWEPHAGELCRSLPKRGRAK